MMSIERETEAEQGTGPGWRDAVVLIGAVVALGIAGYLTWQAVVVGAKPAGCGEGSGCADVLSSRYARFLGVPVSLPAVMAYAGLIVAWLIARRRAAGWPIVAFLAAAIIGAAVWFIFLQLAVVGAICTYCMADHTFGLVAAGVALATALGQATGGGKTLLAPLAGLAVVGAMAGVQSMVAPPLEVVAGPRIGLFEEFDLQAADEPHLGSLETERVMILLFDYACPHCQATHEVVREGQPTRDDLLVVLLPISISTECNDMFQDVAGRFAESCDLAELALAVHEVDAEAFDAFDRWLYDWDGFEPRTAEAARRKAEELVGAEVLEEAIDSGRARERLARNIAILQATGRRTVPVTLLLTEQGVGVAGPIDSMEQVEAEFAKLR